MSDNAFLEEAYKEAEKAALKDEVPVGALIVHDNTIIARNHNHKESKQNPLSHAEIECISQATKKLQSWRLLECTLYTTLEPCYMCAGAIIQARIQQVVCGALDPKAGGESVFGLFSNPKMNHHVEFKHMEHVKSAEILRAFFKKRR